MFLDTTNLYKQALRKLSNMFNCGITPMRKQCLIAVFLAMLFTGSALTELPTANSVNTNNIVFQSDAAASPAIYSVTPIMASRLQFIYINGSGFSDTQPQTIPLKDGSVDTVGQGLTPTLQIWKDNRRTWRAGYQDSRAQDAIGIILLNWSDTQIVIEVWNRNQLNHRWLLDFVGTRQVADCDFHFSRKRRI